MKHIERILLFALVLLLFAAAPCAFSENEIASLNAERLNETTFQIECRLSGSEAIYSPRVVMKTSRRICLDPKSIRILLNEISIYEYSPAANGYIWLIPESERPTSMLPILLEGGNASDGLYTLIWRTADNFMPEESYCLQFTAAVNCAQSDFLCETLYPALAETYFEYSSADGLVQEMLPSPQVYYSDKALLPKAATLPPPESPSQGEKTAPSSPQISSAAVLLPETGNSAAPTFLLAAAISALLSLTALLLRRQRG